MILWAILCVESVELSVLMRPSNATIMLIIASSNPAGERFAPLAVAAVIQIIPLTNAPATPHISPQLVSLLR